MSAFACVKCSQPVIAQNSMAQRLMEQGGRLPMCRDCMRGTTAKKQWDSYEAYLKSPEWKALSYRRLKKDGFKCRLCNSSERLEVHHRTYERIFHEDIEDLTTLCHDCHTCHTYTMKTVNRKSGDLVSYIVVGDRLVAELISDQPKEDSRELLHFAPVTVSLD